MDRPTPSDFPVNVSGPRSRCPECFMDYVTGRPTCAGCGNDYEGWSWKHDPNR